MIVSSCIVNILATFSIRRHLASDVKTRTFVLASSPGLSLVHTSLPVPHAMRHPSSTKHKETLISYTTIAAKVPSRFDLVFCFFTFPLVLWFTFQRVGSTGLAQITA